MKNFTQREIDVLKILICSDEPMTCTDIANVRIDLSQNTVNGTLRRLLKDKDIEVIGFAYSGKVLSRTYKVSDFEREELLNYFVEGVCPYMDMFGLPKLVNRLLDLLNEEQRNKAISEMKKSFKS